MVGREPDVVDAVVAAVLSRGIGAVGATADEAAVRVMAGGGVRLLVIGGGVERGSREALRRAAGSCGADVLETPLRGGNADHYVEREVLPRLRAGDEGAAPGR